MTKALILHLILQASAAYHPWTHHDFHKTLLAIITVESSLCRNTYQPKSSASGCGQVLLSTAAKVAGTPVSKWMLQHNIPLNISISAAYLNLCAVRYGQQWHHAVSCYTTGPNHPINWVYVHKVEEQMK